MARSAYIYLVTEDGEPVAAFTVKWEMEWWIERNPGEYRLFRMVDGRWAEPIAKRPVAMSNDG